MNVFIHPRFKPQYARHPLTLVDVGARGGLRSHWVPAKAHLRLLGFEPDQQEYQKLVGTTQTGNDSVTFFDKALHHRRESIELRITRNPGLSSIFEPNRRFIDSFPEADRFDVMDVRRVDACPLDELLEANHIDDIDFLKADTQGSELHVIEGAARALATSGLGVEVEVEFAPIYLHQPLFADVDATLRGLGYALFDLRPCYWKRTEGRELGGPRGQLVWADALYLKNISALKDFLQPLSPDMRTSKVLRALSVALIYGYWDYALEIARATEEFFQPEEREVMVASLTASGRLVRRQMPLPGRARLAGLFHHLWRMAMPTTDAWSFGGTKLGN